SESLSPFQNYSSSVGSTLVMDIYTTIVIMFFIVLGIIDHEKALKWIVYTVIGVTLYYTWWANIAYFESNWSQFTQNRLRGPNGSPYKDGNIFSILFVIGLPFVLFAIYNVDKKWQKLALILVIPLIWHAMVLCASRGALLSAGVSTLAAAWMIKSKSFNVVLLAGFIGFMITQGGEMVSRTLTTVERAETKEQTETINPRILSWQVGIELIKKYPLFGAGPQRFQEASRFHFPGKSPHVAHNTFLNFASNIGLIAGFIYLSFFWLSWRMYKWNKMHLSKSQDRFHTYVNNASFCSLLGFFTGALFLDLIIFEPFFFLLIIIIANNFILKKHSTATALDEKEKSNIKPSRISISARQQQT
ncbi:MAG: O-antigen ligase, partial [Glaciecola sp.]